MPVNKMYISAEREKMKLYRLPSRERDEWRTEEVRTVSWEKWYVSPELYDRIKRSSRQGIDRPQVRESSGDISGLYPPKQLRVMYDFKDSRPEDEEFDDSPEHQVEKFS